jgi:hypothetical protein
LKKAAQKLSWVWACGAETARVQSKKVFCFFLFTKRSASFLLRRFATPAKYETLDTDRNEETAVPRLPGLAFCALLTAGLYGPARAQDAAYERFQPSQFVQPGQIGQINPHQPGGALACPSLGVLASLYNEESLASGGNGGASVASAQIAAAQAGCVTLPPNTMVQVLSFYPLRATAQDQGTGYLQIQGSATHGAQWIGAGAVTPLQANPSGPAPSAFGIAPAPKAPSSPAPAVQPLPQPNNPPPANAPQPEIPQNGAPTMALPPAPPPLPPTSPADPNANQPGGYVPLPTLAPSSAPKQQNPSGACSDIDSLLKATQTGHGCTQP